MGGETLLRMASACIFSLQLFLACTSNPNKLPALCDEAASALEAQYIKLQRKAARSFAFELPGLRLHGYKVGCLESILAKDIGEAEHLPLLSLC